MAVTRTKLDSMSIEFIPKFTGLAAELWASIPADTKRKLLFERLVQEMSPVTITNFTGVVKGGDL